jgi:hypothetical protein
MMVWLSFGRKIKTMNGKSHTVGRKKVEKKQDVPDLSGEAGRDENESI